MSRWQEDWYRDALERIANHGCGCWDRSTNSICTDRTDNQDDWCWSCIARGALEEVLAELLKDILAPYSKRPTLVLELIEHNHVRFRWFNHLMDLHVIRDDDGEVAVHVEPEGEYDLGGTFEFGVAALIEFAVRARITGEVR